MFCVEERGKYPEVVTTRVPREMRETAKRAAEGAQMSLNEFVRRAIAAHVEALHQEGRTSAQPAHGTA
jgi:predicted HicB family RNase H-like nuclease